MESGEITATQSAALKAAGIFSLIFIAVLAVMVIPSNGILRGEDGSVLNGPFITGLVSILIIYFILVGVVYGLKAGTIKNSADALQAAGFTGIPLMIFFILLCCVVNLFMTSGSAKWYIFAPILVPMMMMLGYSPEFAQVVYRIGDSTTNAITPIYPYIPIAIGMAKKYDKNFGMGSLISMMLPYSIAFLLAWIVQLIIWTVFNLPIGPGAFVFM